MDKLHTICDVTEDAEKILKAEGQYGLLLFFLDCWEAGVAPQIISRKTGEVRIIVPPGHGPVSEKVH